jgi:hypothetical protein
MGNYEKDIKDLIEQMTRQQQGAQNIPNSFQPAYTDSAGTDQSPHLSGQNPHNFNNPDQSPLNPVNSVRPMGKPIAKTPKKELQTDTAVEGGCHQCGMIHPPLRPGERCPMAKVKVKNDKGEEREVDVNKFIANLKNIIISQSESKKIKDIEKLFQNIIVEVTKYLEGYSE